jgi:hypothetical protein
VHSPVDTRKDETDRFDNMVDVASKTFLGVTVACARCHDHKFDAISTEDYYAMFGFLRSSHYRLVRYETDFAHRNAAKALQQLREPLQAEADNIVRGMAQDWLNQSSNANPDLGHVKALLDRCRQWGQTEALRLPQDDSRIILDARKPDLALWQSDGVLYGLQSCEPLSVDFNGRAQGAAWAVHPFHQGVRDRFWDPMNQKLDAVNRQNRYAQIGEAGKILPTRMFTLQTGKVSYLVRGSFRAFASVDSHRLVAGPLHGETLFENSGPNDSFRWVTHSLDRYQGKTIHLEFSPLAENDFGIVQVIDGLPPQPQQTEKQDDGAMLQNLRATVALWLQHPQSLNDPQRSAIAAVMQELLNQPDVWLGADNPHCRRRDELAVRWRNAEHELAGSLPWTSKLAMAMRDGSGVNDSVLIRGNHTKPGHEVPRRNLEALSPDKQPFNGSGSGRLELAQQWIAPENPLVSRVAVNRVWHHLMGRGLAATTDDFGVLGTPPTHPELLDILAQDFIERGWSVKSLIRTICLSQTYQQDSKASPGALQIDPDNKLWSHARVRRLESEAVRDTLLAVTDELDLRWMPENESSVPAHLTDFLEGRGRPNRNGPMDGRGKRSLYLEIRRNFLQPMMTAFDMPNPFSTMGRRNVSNVPAQALILLNDPFVHAVANRWADRIIALYDSDEDRVRAMLKQISLRDPTSIQVEQGIEFVRSGDFGNASEAYRALAHLLLNRKELIFRF